MPTDAPQDREPTAIVTVTPNPSIDVSTAVERVEPDRKLRCEAPVREPGGGGLNAARAILRLGGHALAVWGRGGITGDLLQALLDAEGLRHQPVPIDGSVRESFAVLERSSNRQFRFGMPGPALPPDGLRTFIQAIESLAPAPRLVVGSGSLPPGADPAFYAKLAAAAASRAARFLLDTSGPPLRLALESRQVYLIKPNLRELGALAGRELQDDADIEAAAQAVVEAGGCQVVVASLGAAGALVVTRDGADRIIAPTVPVRSRIGAGDSTVGGLALALARGEPLARAARFGVAAGTAAVMTPGTELCRREDAERLFSLMAPATGS